jgi:hypothetical protein
VPGTAPAYAIAHGNGTSAGNSTAVQSALALGFLPWRPWSCLARQGSPTAIDIGVGITQGIGNVQDAEARWTWRSLTTRAQCAASPSNRHGSASDGVDRVTNILLAGAGIATLFGRLISAAGSQDPPGQFTPSALAEVEPARKERSPNQGHGQVRARSKSPATRCRWCRSQDAQHHDPSSSCCTAILAR